VVHDAYILQILMKKSLKIILSLLIAFIIAILVTVVCLPFIINLNDFKAQIETAVKQQTGRTLTITDELELSFFPWLGLSTGQLRLENADGFNQQPFAQIQQSQIKVHLLALFSKKLEVSEIIFKGLQLHLSKNKQGINNWDDLSPSSSNNAKLSHPFALLAIAGLSIEDASITWDNFQTNQHSQIKNIHLKIGKLAFNQQIPIQLSLKLHHLYADLIQSVDLSANLSINPALDIFQFNGLRVKLVNQGAFIPTESLTINLFANGVFDKTKQYLHLSKLQINQGALQFNTQLDGYFTEPAHIKMTTAVTKFNLAKFLSSLQIDLPKMTDKKALTSLALDFTLQANTNQINLNPLRLVVDDTTLKGSLQLNNFIEPVIQFDLAVDKIDLDRYLPPKTNPKKIISPATTAVAALSSLPVELLRKLNATGKIAIEQLKMSHLTLQGFTLKVDAKAGVIQSNQAIKQFYQGHYQGGFNLNVNAQEPVFIVNENFNDIHLLSLLTAINVAIPLAGLLDLKAEVTGHGKTEARITSSLTGQLSFLLKDSVINAELWQKIMHSVKSLFNATANKIQNKPTQLGATVYINQGLLQNNDLLACMSNIQLTGKGYANLLTQKLDYQIQALPIQQSAIDNELSVINRQPIIIKLSGTFSKPRYRLNIAQRLLNKNSGKITNILEKLDKNILEKLIK
jgi:AsmA protein